MHTVILAGGYGTRLWPLTKQIPKCFLEFGDKKVIESILEKVELVPGINSVTISTNRKFEKVFRDWLCHYKCSKTIELFVENTDSEKHKLGAVGALAYFIEKKKISEDLLIIAGDNLFEFDLNDYITAFAKQTKPNIFLAINNVKSFDTKQTLGVVEADPSGNILSFEEKPLDPKTTLVCTGLYIFPKNELIRFRQYLDAGNSSDTLGYLFEWILSQPHTLKSWEFSEIWFDIGTEKPYLEAKQHYQKSTNRIAKVLVTGGAGYLGGILVPELIKEGLHVRILDSLLYGFKPDERVEFVEGDSRNPAAVIKALDGIDFLVHLAALSNDPTCDLNLNETVEINYNGTKLITETAKKLGVKRIIFISSCSVYGAPEADELVDESFPLKPISLYAQMKVASEFQIRSLLEMADNTHKTDVCILRFATLYGHSCNMRFDLVGNIIPVEAVVDKEIKLFGGSQYRPLLHIGDAARAIIKCLKSDEDFRGECFNVGSNSNNFSIRELTETLNKSLFSDVPVKEFPDKVDNRSYRVAFDKFEKKVNFKAQMDIVEGVKEIAENLRNDHYGNPRDAKYFRVKFLKKTTDV